MDYRRQFNRIFEDITSQYSDLIELNGGWGRESDQKAISDSQLTTLLILELNNIFPEMQQKVIETFKQEIESAELDEQIEKEIPRSTNDYGTRHQLSDGRGFYGEGEIPKFDDISKKE